jgi:inhibitor of KinA
MEDLSSGKHMYNFCKISQAGGSGGNLTLQPPDLTKKNLPSKSFMNFNYKIFPLGDSALTIDFGNRIEEAINDEVIRRFHQFSDDPLTGTMDVIPAYSSLTICYDVNYLQKNKQEEETVSEWVKQQVVKRMQQDPGIKTQVQQLVRIPVCYDPVFAPDLESFAREKNMDADEIIRIHTAGIYRIYMLGFIPGFAYMGEVDDRIVIPRKPQPVNVVAGSVGIAGKQTGIYPLDSPGGWQIIGRTPFKLFDPNRETPVLLRAGDRVQFYSISEEEFFLNRENDESGKT